MSSKEFGTWFIDWNRLLGEMLGEMLGGAGAQEQDQGGSERDHAIILRGHVGSRGVVTGRVRVVPIEDIGGVHLEDGDILVTTMTTPNFLPLMQKAGAVVTEQGGILSHAAIVCRELGKPCLTNVRDATKILHDGDVVIVDCKKGEVSML